MQPFRTFGVAEPRKVLKLCWIESSEKLPLFHQQMAEASPELKAEATELFDKFASMNRDQVKLAFVSAGLKVRESEIDSLIVESEDSRRGVPESEDSSAEDITLSEFIDLLRRKKLRDEAVARQAKQYLDKYDKNSDGKLTKDEVEEAINGVHGEHYTEEEIDGILACIKFDDDGCVDYKDFQLFVY